MCKALYIATLSLGLIVPTWVHAHELWIEPQDYVIAADELIVADIKIGQKFSGIRFPYLTRNFTRFDLTFGNKSVPVTGRMGDFPALKMSPPREGLIIIIHETTPDTITYDDPEKFVAFVKHKDFSDVLEAHKTRGLPKQHFTETYRRFAKSLVAIGNGAGADRVYGLETEIVALANPYVESVVGGMPFEILYQGNPRPDAQVEVFAKAVDGTVDVSLYRTDQAGQVIIPMSLETEYLIDAVVMRPVSGSGKDGAPVWESLWASLTFETPKEWKTQ